MSTPTPNTINQFTVGKMVELTDEWRHPDQFKIVFHRGTRGKVERVIPERGEVEISMRFPHSTPLSTVIPVDLLRRV
jgi:hypothetical protein